MSLKDHTLAKQSQRYSPLVAVVRTAETDAKGRRFPCICGAVMTDGGHALEHFAKHGTVGIEEYRNGAWHAAPYKNIGTWLYDRLRARGESPAAFLSRIQEWGDRLEREAMEQQADDEETNS